MNKTPEIIASWIVNPGNTLLLEVEGDTILGVGLITHDGEIALNYVSLDAQYRGVSQPLIAALEEQAIRQGNPQCRLTSTETARRFYLGIGYREDGPPTGKFGTTGCYLMSKPLAPQPS